MTLVVIEDLQYLFCRSLGPCRLKLAVANGLGPDCGLHPQTP